MNGRGSSLANPVSWLGPEAADYVAAPCRDAVPERHPLNLTKPELANEITNAVFGKTEALQKLNLLPRFNVSNVPGAELGNLDPSATSLGRVCGLSLFPVAFAPLDRQTQTTSGWFWDCFHEVLAFARYAEGRFSVATDDGEIVIGRAACGHFEAALRPGDWVFEKSPVSFPAARPAPPESGEVGTFEVIVAGHLNQLDLSVAQARSETIRDYRADIGSARMSLDGGELEMAGISRDACVAAIAAVLALISGARPAVADPAAFLAAAKFLGVGLNFREIAGLPPFLVSEGVRYGSVAFLTRSYTRDAHHGMAAVKGELMAYFSFSTDRGDRVTWMFPEDSAVPRNEPLFASLLAWRPESFEELAASVPRVRLLVTFNEVVLDLLAQPVECSVGLLALVEVEAQKPLLPREVARPWPRPARAGTRQSPRLLSEGPGFAHLAVGRSPAIGAGRSSVPNSFYLPGQGRFKALFAMRDHGRRALQIFNGAYIRALHAPMPFHQLNRQLAPLFRRLTGKKLSRSYYPWDEEARYLYISDDSKLTIGKDDDAPERFAVLAAEHLDRDPPSGTEHPGNLRPCLAVQDFCPGKAFTDPQRGNWVLCCTVGKNLRWEDRQKVLRHGYAMVSWGVCRYLITREATPKLFLLPMVKKLEILIAARPAIQPGLDFYDWRYDMSAKMSNYVSLDVDRPR